MANFPAIVNTATSIMRGISKTQMVRDLNRVEAEMSNATTVFLDSLKTNRETSTYLDLMKDTLYSQYDEYIEAIDNPMAKSQMTGALDTIKTETKSKVMALMAKNGQVFGSQELKVELEELASRGPDATEAMVGDNSYLFDRATRIGNKISLAGGGGFVTSTQARDLNAKYITSLHKNHTRLLYNEALTTMITGGMPELEAVELVEQVMRSKGGELEDIIKGTDLSGVPAISPLGAQRLSALAKGWEAVVLGSDEQETLINNMRNRGKRISDANSEKEKVELEVNDLKLTELWASGAEGRYEIMEDNNAMLYKIYDPGTSEGRTEIAKWTSNLGEWDLGVKEKTAQEDAKRKYDIEIQRVLVDKDADSIPGLISTIQNDESILDAERDQMTNFLNNLDATFTDDPDDDGFELVKYGFDGKILDLKYAVADKKIGTTQDIRALITELRDDPDMKEHEQDRQERVDELLALYDKANATPADQSASVAKVAAESRISLMMSNKSYNEKQIRDAILKEETQGNLPGDDANTWRNRLPKRAETYLADYNAKIALESVSRFYDAAVRDPDNDEDARSTLAQDQVTAESAFHGLVDSEEYRMSNDVQKKEQLDSLLGDVLAPSVSRGLITKAGEMLGIVGPPTKYEEFKVVENRTYREQLSNEISEEWFNQLGQDFQGKWVAREIAAGGFTSRYKKIDDEWVIQLRHSNTGLMIEQRKGNWYVKFPDDDDFKKATGRTLRDLEAYSG